VRASLLDGIVLLKNAVATVRGNVCEHNGGHGLFLLQNAMATVNEGAFTANGADGIHIQEGAAATIAGAGMPIQITFNTDDGIDVDADAGAVNITSGNIIFDGNGGQPIER
jgi:hypothetical protein